MLVSCVFYGQTSHVAAHQTYKLLAWSLAKYQLESTHPIPLSVEETFGLKHHLLVGILFRDACGKVGGVGVDLH